MAERDPYIALRDVIARNIGEFTRSVFDVNSGKQVVQGDQVEAFWALKDVTFQVKQGRGAWHHRSQWRREVDAAESAKPHPRITESIKGRIRIQGRVASLLEVGTEFHYELIGRENIAMDFSTKMQPSNVGYVPNASHYISSEDFNR